MPYLPLLFMLLTACSGLSPAVRDMHVKDISYKQAKQDIEGYENVPVRWGGIIIDVENEDAYSLMQVLYYPLDYFGRPRLNKPEGRFVIKSPEFLDPAIYASDREITAAGLIDGMIERIVDKKKIMVPMISSTAIHLWPSRYRSNDYGYYGYPSYQGYYRWYPGVYGGW